MQSAPECHAIEDCPGLFVDAFSKAFRSKLQDSSNSFILTHYHGDHYNGLPRDNKHQGPALIHCTPVTAELLIQVHGVDCKFIVAHEYGTTWTHQMNEREQAKITFLDANHCPGAALVLIELPDKTFHLHCGDCRFHERMKEYPQLKKAVKQRQIGVVYLDTTYGHPKHTLIPQDKAVDTIASHVEQVFRDDDSNKTKTLVLLSCYSIGKEKVLWETSKRTNQLVYVSERKHKMLECIQGYEEDESNQILSRCTLNPTKSDLHVIPMGMAGEMWPYFQPNYKACADYVEKLEQKYDKVLAIIPTGWADATNWNKKNAVCKRRVDFKEKSGVVDVEIRLVCYSEHSAFPELCSFVEFLKPRQIVPTVFADKNDRRKIEEHFRKYIDTSRAKQHFFKGMSSSVSSVSSCTMAVKCEAHDNDAAEVINVDGGCLSESKKRKLNENSHDEQVATLVSMGFNSESALYSLEKCDGNVEAALDSLLNPEPKEQTKNAGNTSKRAESATKASPTTLKAFFSPKPRGAR